jgi:hypothetical protein
MTQVASALDEERRLESMKRWTLRQQILQLFTQTEPTPRLNDSCVESQSSSAATRIGPGSSFLDGYVPEFPAFSASNKYKRMRSVSINRTDDSCVVKQESPPDLRKKPGNRNIVVSALRACFEYTAAPVIDLLERSTSQHFVILLNNDQDFLGLYRLEQRSESLHVLYGVASCPQIITQKHSFACYRFDSGERRFKQLKTGGLSIGTDAVSLLPCKRNR